METPESDSALPVLVVEDDHDLTDLLQIHLSDLGYEAEMAFDGKKGLEKALEGDYALVILDIMLPELDGFEVCKRLRAEKRSLPILMLTSKSEELDKVLGLEMGADDYVTKPFSLRELMARIKALFRRIEVDQEESGHPSGEKLCYGSLRIEPLKRRVVLGNETVDLTAKEFDLLLLFARHPGRAYSRDELLNQVWGYQYGGYSHTVNTHINRLRGKIEAEPSEPEFIKTVWGVGYRFAEQEELAS